MTKKKRKKIKFRTYKMELSEKDLKNLEIRNNPDGVTIWLKDQWILDASTIKNDGTISLEITGEHRPDKIHFKEIDSGSRNHFGMQLVKPIKKKIKVRK